jgi:hypothetical protein
VSRASTSVTVKNCFEFVSFQSFLCFDVNKVIFVLMFGTQYYFFVRCSMPRTELLWGSNSQCDFLWRCNFAIDCVVKMLLWKMYMVFLYILVFAFCMFKTVKISVTAECNWGDVKLLSRVGFLAYVKKNVSFVTSIPKTWSG